MLLYVLEQSITSARGPSGSNWYNWFKVCPDCNTVCNTSITPTINVPNTPTITVPNTPTINVPNTPTINVPNTPTINVPNTPTINVPKLHLQLMFRIHLQLMFRNHLAVRLPTLFNVLTFEMLTYHIISLSHLFLPILSNEIPTYIYKMY